MKQPRPVLSLLVLAALLLGSAGAAHAQADGDRDDFVFEGAVEVPLVNVEVHVLDKDGRPVVGLTADDFEILEDGEPVTISNFYSVQGLPRRDKDIPVRMRGTPSPPEVVEQREEDRLLQLVLYVDNANIGQLSRRRAGAELLDLFDERIERGDRVMVVSGYPSLRVHTPFTRDLGAIHTAVEEALGRAGLSAADVQRRRLVNQFERLGPTELDLIRILKDSIRLYSEEKAVEIRRSLWELRAFIGSLSGLPGRKVVIHLSEGVPEEPGQDLFNMFDAAFGGIAQVGSARFESADYNISRDLLALAEEANAASVTFHSLDASGGESSVIATPVESRGLSLSGGRIAGPEVEALRKQNRQNPLRLLATETGGIAILNANRPGFELAERQGEVFDTYYSLGYISPSVEHDEFRPIRVRVKNRKDVRVRHREGYVRQGPFSRVENRTVAALLHEYADNPLGVFLEVGEPKKQGRKKFQVPVEVKVPLEKIVLLPFAEDYRGRIRLWVGFRNADGTFGLAQERIVPLVVPNEQLAEAQKGHYTLEVDMEFRPGSHRLAVGVFDEVGSKASFVPHDLYVER